jgi:hypothetical protein
MMSSIHQDKHIVEQDHASFSHKEVARQVKKLVTYLELFVEVNEELI